jgi:hypothetical protein
VGSLVGDVIHWVVHTVKDGWRWVKDRWEDLKDGVSFLISEYNNVVWFVLKIADKLFQFALHTLLVVYQALNALLKLVCPSSSPFICFYLYINLS